jgi:chorismate synthase
MRGNSFGKLFSITSFGESHGKAMGVVIDGMPPRIKIDLNDLAQCLKKRAPGQHPTQTSRTEADQPIILSGIKDQLTLGSPIAVIVENKNQNANEYNKLKDTIRPGHADETTLLKYGIRDARGGGRASGRETIARVIGGYFAGLIIPQVKTCAYIHQFGSEIICDKTFISEQELQNIKPPFYFPQPERNDEIETLLLSLKKVGDSIGGIIKVIVDNCPIGLGEPCFDKLKADLSKALLSIGACVGVNFGQANQLTTTRGKYCSTQRQFFGGIEGGISNGERISLEVAIKPPTTVGEAALQGRHDPCIMPRVIPVIEAMVKIVLADHYLRQKAYSR